MRQTFLHRPDLLATANLDEQEKELLAEVEEELKPGAGKEDGNEDYR